MDEKTLEHIKSLTDQDEKNLTQKTLKLTEEVGELAKVVLPFENAFATNHRFVDRERILEELADVFLCRASIMYDMGFTEEEFEAMVVHKMKYWGDLQARERKLHKKNTSGWAVPYEIHITVGADRTDLDNFKQVCSVLGVKPILLDLHVKGDDPIKDLMTSSVFMGNNREAYGEMKRISSGLMKAGFGVVREKIETIPWHPAAPSLHHERTEMPPNCYFECHLAVVCTDEREGDLDMVVNAHYAHKSRNVFKRLNNGAYTVMVTLRKYDGYIETFKEKLEKLKSSLESSEFEVAKEIIEFSIYDTRVSHDARWITGESAEKAA